MMSRSTRSSLLALLSAGLLTLGATGCFSPEALEAFGAEVRSAESQSAEDGAEGVTTTLAGEVTYLAPNEYIVEDQAFYVAEDTQINGGINVCPAEEGVDEAGYGIVTCSYAEFDAALQGGTVVLAEVDIVDGVAETITEYQEDGHLESGAPGGSGDGDSSLGGVTTTLVGEVTYLAPGEYIVNSQAFYVAEDTLILGGLYACAPETPGAGQTGTVECSFDEFETALRNGTVVLAEVEVVDGVAESITEYQA